MHLPTPPEISQLSLHPKISQPPPPKNFLTPRKFLNPPENFSTPRKFLNPPENFSTPPRKYLNPSRKFLNPRKFFKPPDEISTPLEKISTSKNMLRGNPHRPPPQHPFFLFLFISFPSLLKKNLKISGGGGLNPLNPPP